MDGYFVKPGKQVHIRSACWCVCINICKYNNVLPERRFVSIVNNGKYGS